VEALFNTLLEDGELMGLLFSLLDGPAPLSSKTAGYFGRVVGTLLLRKTNEMMQHLQDNVGLLEKLVNHVDTVSIAEIIKRIVGADDQSSILFLPQYAQWLAETQLVDLLLARLSESSSADAQANAADILSAIAHTQPSPLALKLTNSACITTLFSHAMAPGKAVLVPALDVCIALVEPRRSAQALEATEAPMADAMQRAKAEAVDAIVEHLPKLMGLLDVGSPTSTSGNHSSNGEAGQPLTQPSQETPYGVLTPPLGRARLRVVELLAVLLRSGLPSAEAAVMSADAVRICLGLFARYPFNNLLHSQVVGMLVAVLTRASDSMLQYVFEQCKLLEWLTSLPTEVKPAPRAGQEEAATSRAPLRAGYMGHVTQIASTLESFSTQPDSTTSSDATTGPASSSNDSSSPATASRSSVPSFLSGHAEWHS
jgi:serine/threonine-protein phosphatase 6 regulatory subunit 3